MIGIEILVKKYPSTVSLNGYPNMALFYSRFSLPKNRRQELLSRVCTRYRKAVDERKDIENDFYVDGSSNDDLESKF